MVACFDDTIARSSRSTFCEFYKVVLDIDTGIRLDYMTKQSVDQTCAQKISMYEEYIVLLCAEDNAVDNTADSSGDSSGDNSEVDESNTYSLTVFSLSDDLVMTEVHTVTGMATDLLCAFPFDDELFVVTYAKDYDWSL